MLKIPLVGLGYKFKLSASSSSPAEILIEDKVLKNCHEVKDETLLETASHSDLTLHLYVDDGVKELNDNKLVLVNCTFTGDPSFLHLIL